MEGRPVDNITEATPVEIDTEIARLSVQVMKLKNQLERTVDHVLSYAGLRIYVAATWSNRRSSYKYIGTFEEGVERLREFAADYKAASDRYHTNGYDHQAARFPKPLSNYSGTLNSADIDQAVEDRDRLEREINDLRSEVRTLENEWVRRGRWTRMFLVTSSNGHIHSSTNCSTCRITTGFGWMPEFSGMDQFDLLVKLGVHAETACTVCYPDAPVKDTKKKLTVAKATKMIAGPVIID